MLWRCVALASGLLLLSPSADAETAAIVRVALVVAPGTAVDRASLERTVSAYLAESSTEVVSVEDEIPVGPYEDVRDAMVELAAREMADLVAWCRSGSGGGFVLFILHVAGDTALVRRVELETQSAPTLRRTVAAVLRTVVETGMLEAISGSEPGRPCAEASGAADSTVAAEADEGSSDPSPPENPEPAPSPELVSPAPPAAESSSSEQEASVEARRLGRRRPTTFSGSLGYGVRIGEGPAPFHQTVNALIGVDFLTWGTAEIGGRLGPPAGIPGGSEGTVWHAAASGALGVAFPLSAVNLALLAGVELEWLWGEVALGESGEVASFSNLAVGMVLRGAARVSLVAGLELRVAVEGVVRPERRVYLLRGKSILGSGHVELGIAIGLGWRFS